MFPRTAKSNYTLETIERRLSELREASDSEAKREIAYLEDLKERKFPEAAATAGKG